MASCRSCAAPVLWVYTQKGKRMPLNAEPFTGDTDGRNLFEIVGETRREDDPAPVPVVRAALKGADALPGLDPPPRYESHFATCVDAEQHRKRR